MGWKLTQEMMGRAEIGRKARQSCEGSLHLSARRLKQKEERKEKKKEKIKATTARLGTNNWKQGVEVRNRKLHMASGDTGRQTIS